MPSEAEGVTIAAGVVLGGRQAACYLETSGLYVSSYSLLTIGRRLGVPALLIVEFLGGVGDQRNSFLHATVGQGTMPLLDGLEIDYVVIEKGEGLQTHPFRNLRANRLSWQGISRTLHVHDGSEEDSRKVWQKNSARFIWSR